METQVSAACHSLLRQNKHTHQTRPFRMLLYLDLPQFVILGGQGDPTTAFGTRRARKSNPRGAIAPNINFEKKQNTRNCYENLKRVYPMTVDPKKGRRLDDSGFASSGRLLHDNNPRRRNCLGHWMRWLPVCTMMTMYQDTLPAVVLLLQEW